MYKRILICGHAGRGKSTFAQKLSEKLGIQHYTTDDFFYKVKFNVPNEREESVQLIKRVYEMDSWIMDGTTSRLIKPGIERADVIFVLKFKNIIPQYYFIIKRSIFRKDSLRGTWGLLRHITFKRYKKDYGSHLPTVKEFTEVYDKKVIELNSMREIDDYLNSIK
jgi:adenylate kinase family enzyme